MSDGEASRMQTDGDEVMTSRPASGEGAAAQHVSGQHIGGHARVHIGHHFNNSTSYAYGGGGFGLGSYFSRRKRSKDLGEAAANGYVPRLRALLRGTVDIDYTDDFRCTALHRAAVNGQNECVRILLDAGSAVNAGLSEESSPTVSFTPLYLAADVGHLEVVYALLAANGIRVDGEQGWQGPPLAVVIRHGHLDIAKVLVEAGAPLSWGPCLSGGTFAGMLSTVARSLEKWSIIDHEHERWRIDSFRPIDAATYASVYGQAAILAWLLAEKRDAEWNIDALLAIATSRLHSECVSVLVDAGAVGTASVTEAAQRYDHRVLQILLWAPANPEDKANALGEAALMGKSGAVRLLINTRTDVNMCVHDHGPALHCAVEGGDLASTKMLVKAGANINKVWQNCKAVESGYHYQDGGAEQAVGRQAVMKYLRQVHAERAA